MYHLKEITYELKFPRELSWNVFAPKKNQTTEFHISSTFTCNIFDKESRIVNNKAFNESLDEDENRMNETINLQKLRSAKSSTDNSLPQICKQHRDIRSPTRLSTSTHISNFDFNYSGKEARNVIEANLWSDASKCDEPNNMHLSYSQKEKESDSRINNTIDLSPQFIRRSKSETLPLKELINESIAENHDDVKLFQKYKRSCKRIIMNSPWPDDVRIYRISDSTLFSATSPEDPFLASKNFYSEEWMQRQEIEFTKWLNGLLTPHADLACTSKNIVKVDVARLYAENRQKDNIMMLADPQKVRANNRLDSVRRKAMNFFRSREIQEILTNAICMVEKKRIIIREDKNIHLDLGLQAEIMQLLLCYNPLWLRIGLETIYGETIPLSSNTDVISLSKFLISRFFSDPFLRERFGIQNLRRTFHKRYSPEIKKFIVNKFLTLIYFLDQSKLGKLMPFDPCLFCVTAPIKESKKILLEFSKALLSGVGDITKYLRAVNYELNYKQSSLDEIAYVIRDIRTDLRDGIRLARIMEIILIRKDLTNLMRAPAISRLQKIHNIQVTMDALNESSFILQGNIRPKDIVDGHREKTLSLLWQIIHKFKAPIFVKAASTIQTRYRARMVGRQMQIQYLHLKRSAICLQKYTRGYLEMKYLRYNFLLIRNNAIKIQRWWRLVRIVR